MQNSQTSLQPFNPSSLQALLGRLQVESERRQSRTKLSSATSHTLSRLRFMQQAPSIASDF